MKSEKMKNQTFKAAVLLALPGHVVRRYRILSLSDLWVSQRKKMVWRLGGVFLNRILSGWKKMKNTCACVWKKDKRTCFQIKFWEVLPLRRVRPTKTGVKVYPSIGFVKAVASEKRCCWVPCFCLAEDTRVEPQKEWNVLFSTQDLGPTCSGFTMKVCTCRLGYRRDVDVGRFKQKSLGYGLETKQTNLVSMKYMKCPT